MSCAVKAARSSPFKPTSRQSRAWIKFTPRSADVRLRLCLLTRAADWAGPFLKILITGSIAGFMPGSYQAVYNGTKAFLDSFSFALRAELKDTGVTVTCLMPGATETEFFERADMLDTKVGQQK